MQRSLRRSCNAPLGVPFEGLRGYEQVVFDIAAQAGHGPTDTTHAPVAQAQETSMKDWLTVIALTAVMTVHAMALLIVVFGTVQAFVRSIRAMFDTSPRGRRFQAG